MSVKDHKFILFGTDHYNVLGMCRSVGEEGISPIVVMIGESLLVKHCKYVKTIHYVDSIEAGYKLILEKYSHEAYKPFILTGADDVTQYLDQHYNELIDKFYFFNGGGQGVITHFMDKETICQVAVSCGIDEPKGEVLKKGELPQTLRYPVITKVTMSTKGAWKNDVHICQNEEELKEAYKQIKADELLVQEFIEKKNELCVDGISINGGEEVWFPNTSEYIRFTKQGYGNYMWIKPYTNEEVRQKIQNILKKTHFSGIFSLECLIDKNDHLYFLEVNFRNSTWSYAYTYAGLNLPYQWAKGTLEGHFDKEHAHVMTKPFTAMAEFSDLKECLVNHEASLFTWIRQFLSCNVKFWWNPKDNGPFFAELTEIPRRIKEVL